MTGLPNDPLRATQWYLNAADLPGATVDLNVAAVWADYTGRGVVVGIYDSMVERDHPDLAAGYDAAWHVDGLIYDSTASGHGTNVAGVIGARANNGIGMVGVAYESTITSLPVIFSKTVTLPWVELAMARAKDLDVINMSYGGTIAFDPSIDAGAWAPIAASYDAAAAEGRGGLGTVMVAAAGNYRGTESDANLARYQSERHVLLVGAVNTVGEISEYSTPGANLLVVAPSSDGFMEPGVATTDRQGVEGSNDGYNTTYDPVPLEYTTRFGGTSATSPMVAGIAALMLEANPNLGWRDVREILALSARHTGSAVGAGPSALEATPWFVNGATMLNGGGFHVSANYGFGLVDALAAVRLAETWDVQQTAANEETRTASFAGSLALDAATPVRTVDLVLGAGLVAEQVTLFLDIAHTASRDLEVTLTSPRGTVSVLFSHSYASPALYGGTGAFKPWTFVSNAFMGEDATGTWQLTVRDTVDNVANGSLVAATLTAYGHGASPDDRYVYTNEFGVLSGMAHAGVIHDGGGTDTIDAAAVTAASVIDLRAGAVGSINGTALAVAAGSTIENAIGGDGNDRLVGNGAANHLRGGRGADTLLGGGGNDTLEGGEGRDGLDAGEGDDTLLGGGGVDVMRGRGGADTLEGGDGDDWLEGGAGADILRGGGGTDTASYVGGTLGVTVSLVAGPGGLQPASGGEAEGDLLYDIENVTGGSGDDTLTGNNGANWLNGAAGDDVLDGAGGNDTLVGGVGADTLRGGEGRDVVSYAGSLAGVTVSLVAAPGSGLQSASGGEAAGDALSGFEAVIGSALGDVITGDDGVNVIWSRGGDDTVDGGGGNDWIEGGEGADTLDGGAGWDALSYAASSAGVTVRLAQLDGAGRQFVAGGHATGDLVRNFEHVTGSAWADAISGDGRMNHIAGGGGGDVLEGGGGNDIFFFGPADLLSPTPTAILDFRPDAAPGAERDRISLSGIDAVSGGTDDAFSFVGTAAFTQAGQLRAWFDGTDTFLEGNTLLTLAAGVDATPELRIVLKGADLTALLGAGDFTL